MELNLGLSRRLKKLSWQKERLDVKLLPSTQVKGASVLVDLSLLQEECYVLIIRGVSRGTIKPGSIKGYTRMIISIYKTRLIY